MTLYKYVYLYFTLRVVELYTAETDSLTNTGYRDDYEDGKKHDKIKKQSSAVANRRQLTDAL